jgi:hypothetical protein
VITFRKLSVAGHPKDTQKGKKTALCSASEKKFWLILRKIGSNLNFHLVH